MCNRCRELEELAGGKKIDDDEFVDALLKAVAPHAKKMMEDGRARASILLEAFVNWRQPEVGMMRFEDAVKRAANNPQAATAVQATLVEMVIALTRELNPEVSGDAIPALAFAIYDKHKAAGNLFE